MGKEASAEDLAFFDMLEAVHAENGKIWYLYRMRPEETGRDSLSAEYRKEYDALLARTDEIVKNAAYYEPEAWESTKEGTAVSFTTTDIDGNPVKSEDLFAENRLTMLNFWGITCGPCINEMPDLAAISTEYADKGVAIVGVVQELREGDDGHLQETKDILEQYGITYKNLRVWAGYNEMFTLPGTPTTYFIDSTGRILGDPVIGAKANEYRVRLEEYLKELQ